MARADVARNEAARPKENAAAPGTAAGVFADMQKSFRPAKARNVRARYLFQIGGMGGGLWWITVNDGTCQFGRGRLEKPDVIITASDRDWVLLSTDALDATWAWFTGRVKIEGSKNLARKLDEMFP